MFIAHCCNGGIIHIALLADTHTTRGTRDTQPQYREHLEQVIDAVNTATVDLVIVAGDLTENGKDEEFQDFKQQIRRFAAPVLCVPGNHDVGPKWTPTKVDSVSSEAVARYEQQLGPTFFSKTVAGLRVIGLNSSIMGTTLPLAQAQWKFLEDAFASDANTSTIAFFHYPPFRDFATERGGGYWNIEPEPRVRLLALLQRPCVKAIFTGHTHQALVNHYRGIPIVTGEPVSFGLPRGRQQQGWTLVTITESGDLHAENMNLPGL
jgi:3',5'-cyclic AMP phosphodiesterase CpdA